MPGPRQDKKRAWDALEATLKRMFQVAELLESGYGRQLRQMDREDVEHGLRMLRTSGRLDARQVWYVKKLIEAVWRLRQKGE